MRKLKPPVDKADHIQGDTASAKIEVVEYGDYQCPHCGEAYPIVKKIQQQFGKELLFVFRNFPLQEIHPDANNAALAVEAAGLQGKFWEMHDIVFENQEELDWKSLVAYANTLQLNLQKFKTDIENGGLQERIDADIEGGLRSGVNGTPSFFVNGVKFEGDWGYESLAEYLSSTLQQ